jgi:hypothetical protein
MQIKHIVASKEAEDKHGDAKQRNQKAAKASAQSKPLQRLA